MHSVSTDINQVLAILGLNASTEARIPINHLASLTGAKQHGLAFCTARGKSDLSASAATAIIMTEELANHYPGQAYVIKHPEPLAAFVSVMKALMSTDRKKRLSGIHPQAVCDPSSTIAPTASIGANVTVEANAVIEANVQIDAGCYVGENTIIKKNSKLNANVTIHRGCVVGENCILHSGTCIGSDGFGYIETKSGLEKIPHIGNVIIGNNVEIGANCSIDRGMLDNTEIHDGVKLDNLVHIAHNVKLSKNCAIAGLCGIAGSTKVGENLRMGGMSGINGQITVTNNVAIGGGTSITSTINKSGFYIGVMPAQLEKNWARSAIAVKKLGNKGASKVK